MCPKRIYLGLRRKVEDGQVVQTCGERKREVKEKTDNWYCIERNSSRFLQRFRLTEGVRASMESGVLHPQGEGQKAENVH
ncbi:17.9 kDa class I heat shock protein [Apostasia shenzhenica]|uniref:17.9 kDa class I heat shock protein n=1 Tax=Apostasia shenzhenica TaxID=1088818 RepID=A0A2I0AQ35_9ASPA|nr:17.9 kDa class I heat shock protein [Apostasia shenzhenica]